jgi:hypothetical protein
MPKNLYLNSMNGIDNYQDTGVVGTAIFKLISRKLNLRKWIGFMWLGIGTGYLFI